MKLSEAMRTGGDCYPQCFEKTVITNEGGDRIESCCALTLAYLGAGGNEAALLEHAPGDIDGPIGYVTRWLTGYGLLLQRYVDHPRHPGYHISLENTIISLSDSPNAHWSYGKIADWLESIGE